MKNFYKNRGIMSKTDEHGSKTQSNVSQEKSMLLLWILTDEEAHERILRIYRRFHDDMIHFARVRLRRMGDVNYLADSEDVVQNAFVKITKYKPAFPFRFAPCQSHQYIL